MSIFDITIVACLVIAVFSGIKNGLIGQVVSLLSICLGIWLSVKSSAEVGSWLHSWLSLDKTVLRVIAFVLIFCVVATGLGIVGKLLEKVVKIVLLGWLNRLLGAVIACIGCLLVLCIMLMIFDALNGKFSFVSSEYLSSTVFYEPLKNMSYSIFPYLKELFFWK